MLFDLINAPASSERCINKIFFEKLDIFVFVYFNNIFIYTNNDGQNHIAAVWYILK